jgi:hypothetical protein
MTGQEPRTSAVPPPPRGKKAGQSPNTRHRNNAESDDDSVDGAAEVPTGAGYNVSLLHMLVQTKPPCCSILRFQAKVEFLQNSQLLVLRLPTSRMQLLREAQ